MSSPVPVPFASLGSTTRILVCAVAAIGFLFDTYELLMFPVIGSDAIAELVYHKDFADLTLAEVAYRCGFTSQSQFTTLFRRFTGITPGKFRAG